MTGLSIWSELEEPMVVDENENESSPAMGVTVLPYVQMESLVLTVY